MLNNSCAHDPDRSSHWLAKSGLGAAARDNGAGQATTSCQSLLHTSVSVTAAPTQDGDLALSPLGAFKLTNDVLQPLERAGSTECLGISFSKSPHGF